MNPPEWKLIGQLLELTRDWNRFELIEPEVQKRVYAIGVELDKLGGYEAMLYAYRTCRSANKCASDLSHIWDGIGSWRW